MEALDPTVWEYILSKRHPTLLPKVHQTPNKSLKSAPIRMPMVGGIEQKMNKTTTSLVQWRDSTLEPNEPLS